MYSKVLILNILCLIYKTYDVSAESVCFNTNGGSIKVSVEISLNGNNCQCSTNTNSSIPQQSHSNALDHLGLYRPGTGSFWLLKNDNGVFTPLYKQGDPGNGVGGYDLKSVNDRAFAFDYDHSGNQNDIALYRPGTGIFWILKNNNGIFTPIYQNISGIGGYDLQSITDEAFAFDYQHTGKNDHIVIYRPGTGILWILHNNNGNFVPVFVASNTNLGYDLKSLNDRVIVFDFDHSGKSDHLVLYRPGTGVFYILKNDNGSFISVFKSHGGCGGYDLKSLDDKIFAFDYNSSGKMDHLVLYRPGTGTMRILKNQNGVFTAIYIEGSPGNGIGGYDLKSVNDRAFAFDYERSGKHDHIVLYRPGTGSLWILQNRGGNFKPVYAEGSPGRGIAGYDIKSTADQVFAINY